MAVTLRVLILFCLLYAPAYSQRVTYSSKLGIPLTSPYGDGDESRPIAAGFGGIVKLRGPMQLEVDAINRMQRLTLSASSPDPDYRLQEGRLRERIWDIPILYRHQHGDGRAWLLGSGGFVMRSRSRTLDYVIRTDANPGQGQHISRTEHHWQQGFVLGGGFGFRAGYGVAIEPEFRFTRVGDLRRDRVAEVMIGIRCGN